MRGHRATSVRSDPSSPPGFAPRDGVDKGWRALADRDHRMVIRLDQAAPPLFRSDGTVQFGAPARAVIDCSTPWVEAAVGALEAGTTRSELRALARLHRAGDGDADALLRDLAPALRRPRRGDALIVQTADDLPGAAVRAVLAALPARTEVVAWAGPRSAPVAPGRRVVLLAAHRVDPRRASALLREDVVHIPLVLDGASARIGPVVHPGRTACLSCLDVTAHGLDDSWPLIAAQLLARPCRTIDVALAAEAGRAARHLLSARPGIPSRSLRLHADSIRRVWEDHHPSADCRCRSLGGTATARDPRGPVHEPSSPTASGRPS